MVKRQGIARKRLNLALTAGITLLRLAFSQGVNQPRARNSARTQFQRARFKNVMEI